MLTVYGIPNCDTMKKAFGWLKANGVAYVFHDYRKVGIDSERLAAWCGRLGWEKVLNKASTTFKALTDADKADLDQATAIRLMVMQPSMIKRPIFETETNVVAGFKPGDELLKLVR